MKKVEVEKLISKALIITGVVFCIMFGMWLIQQGYFNYNTVLTMPIVMVVLSFLFAIGAVICIIFGIVKNTVFYGYASGFAALAILSMLLKINYEIKGLHFLAKVVNVSFSPFKFSTQVVDVKFFPLSMGLLLLAVLIYWIVTIVKIIRN